MARKPTFSERVGVVKPRTVLQLEEPDEQLKIRLWNVIDRQGNHPHASYFVKEVWGDILVRPLDTIRNSWTDLREAFMTCPWNKLYEIVELAAGITVDAFVQMEEALELGGSGYRFLGGELIPITDQEQLAEIAKAREITASKPLATIREHLDQALACLADRKEPDYRNSVKESITAVEGLVNLINGKGGGKTGKTLGDALKTLGDMGGELHPAMISAFSSLYGWTSDAGGIRHALKDGVFVPGPEEARFMLVTVSAFVNFLIAKASKVGIDLTK